MIAVLTKPGDRAKKTMLSSLNLVAYFATAMFSPALLMLYAVKAGSPMVRVASRSAKPVLMVITLAVVVEDAFWRRGRNMFVV